MSDAWSDATPDDVVSLALEADLDLIAVTDHNTVQWCRPRGTREGFLENDGTIQNPAKEIHASESISAYEIVDPELRDQFRDGLLEGYPRSVASIQGSDCYPSKGDSHQLDAIGNRHCYISLDQPGLTGLRLACLDPDIRIRLMNDDRPDPCAAVEGLWVSGGFLKEQVFRFNDNITCLIGDTGSGKSLTLELVRFALD